MRFIRKIPCSLNKGLSLFLAEICQGKILVCTIYLDFCREHYKIKNMTKGKVCFPLQLALESIFRTYACVLSVLANHEELIHTEADQDALLGLLLVGIQKLVSGTLSQVINRQEKKMNQKKNIMNKCFTGLFKFTVFNITTSTFPLSCFYTN